MTLIKKIKIALLPFAFLGAFACICGARNIIALSGANEQIDVLTADVKKWWLMYEERLTKESLPLAIFGALQTMTPEQREKFLKQLKEKAEK